MKKTTYLMLTFSMILTSCGIDKKKYDAEVEKVTNLTNQLDTLKKEMTAMQIELDGYRYSPAKLLADIKAAYSNKEYSEITSLMENMTKFHPDADEYKAARAIQSQAEKDQEAARRKAQAEAEKAERERRAKMSKIERIMEKYNCDEDIATLISKGQVRRGMTDEQCRAAWGRPYDVNRTTSSWGVHEQWCYRSGNYLYFENGILTTIQN